VHWVSNHPGARVPHRREAVLHQRPQLGWLLAMDYRIVLQCPSDADAWLHRWLSGVLICIVLRIVEQ
jgi:hypothetical protein